MQDIRVGIYTLGCKVNQYESEAIAEGFEALGYSVISAEDECDVYVINTCTVTAESDRKARQFIRRARSANNNAYIIVTGCMAQTSPKEIASIDGVDHVCGNTEKMSVVTAAHKLINSGKKNDIPVTCVSDINTSSFEKMSISKFDRTRAYIKIEDGCESKCTYCIIPAARGKIRSKRPDEIISEVSALVKGGCREIVLTGIETASYGKDLNGIDLADLLCKVDRIDGIGRVRLGSLDPSHMTDSFVSRIASLSSLAPHFHLSLQSGSDRVLALMKRKYNSDMAMKAIERLRNAIPSAMFTTDVIVGFPGETEDDFMKTVEFAKKASFLKIHVFPYSKRAGTPAASMQGQLSKQVKHDRVLRLLEIEKETRAKILDDIIAEGNIYDVLFETYENGYASGHTANFIEVCVPSNKALRSEFRNVKLISTDGERCFGELI